MCSCESPHVSHRSGTSSSNALHLGVMRSHTRSLQSQAHGPFAPRPCAFACRHTLIASVVSPSGDSRRHHPHRHCRRSQAPEHADGASWRRVGHRPVERRGQRPPLRAREAAGAGDRRRGDRRRASRRPFASWLSSGQPTAAAAVSPRRSSPTKMVAAADALAAGFADVDQHVAHGPEPVALPRLPERRRVEPRGRALRARLVRLPARVDHVPQRLVRPWLERRVHRSVQPPAAASCSRRIRTSPT